MSIHFWVWFFYVLWFVFGGFLDYQTPTRSAYWYGPHLLLAILLFALCLSISGAPTAALVK